ncbi:MAG TPA: hypothetical protein DCM87_14060 [Planctomycetes bacterium]|nr:hypothetical protein [Planctomycetota bacterium]
MVRYRRFGEVALELGLIGAADLAEALAEQAERRARGDRVLLGQILLERALMDETGIMRVLDTLYPVEHDDEE